MLSYWSWSHKNFPFLDLFLSYHLNTTESRRRRDNSDVEFDDISLNNKPQLEFRCKYDRDINVNSDLAIGESSETEEDLTKSGFLQYTATVNDVKIGRDQFTEVVITPKHHLTSVYAV